MNDFIAQGLVLTSQAVFITATLFQYLKIISTKTTKGLSGWTYTLFTGSIIAWGVYGLKEEQMIFFFAHLISALICFSVLGHIYAKSKVKRKMEAYVFIVGGGLLFLILTLPNYSGWIGLFYGMIARIPQYKHLFKDSNLRGVSVLSCLLFIIANTLTVAYAMYYEMTSLVVGALLAGASSFFITVMVAKKSVRAYN